MPDNIDIHPVILQIHLKPSFTPNTDPYNRDPLPLGLIDAGPNATEDPQWEIESIIRKRTRNGRDKYLVRWAEHGPEEDWWMDYELIRENAADLVDKYEGTLADSITLRIRPTIARPTIKSSQQDQTKSV